MWGYDSRSGYILCLLPLPGRWGGVNLSSRVNKSELRGLSRLDGHRLTLTYAIRINTVHI